jgi:uncharacterized protein YndB with AHSA1/START domain
MKELVITRTFDVPRELVFRAWTERQHLDKWWGPKGFTMLSSDIDLRPGGVFLYGMRAPAGEGEMWGRWVFREIDPPRLLSFVVSFSNPQGEIVRAPFSANWPLETLSTITFDEQDGKTTLTMRGVPVGANDVEQEMFESMFPSMQQGWGGTLDQLADFLAKEQQ